LYANFIYERKKYNMNMTKSFYLIAVLFTAIALFSCKEKEAVPTSEFQPFISAYTGGVIFSNSSIWIELANEHPNAEPNTEISERLFSFSPSIKGKAFWESSRRIRFIPDENALKNGQSYRASFDLGALLDVPKRLRTFNFEFQVEERHFSLQTYPLSVNPNNSELMNTQGVIIFSDNIGNVEDVQKMFSAKTTENQDFSVIVSATSNPQVFNFSIDDIQRQAAEFRIDITANGRPIGTSKTETRWVIIPALDSFEVLDAAVIYEPEFGIQVTFSDLVSTRQNLQGLITLTNVRNYTRQVIGNKVMLYFDRTSLQNVEVIVNENLRSQSDKTLGKTFSKTLAVEIPKPQVELRSTGNILPNSDNLMVPFRAVSLRAVDLNIIRIYENNILMFLQSNRLSGSNELRRSGRLVYRTTLRLDNDPTKDLTTWNDFSIDLSNLFEQEPGAIYRVELSFRQAYSAYPCGEETDLPAGENLRQTTSSELTEEDMAFWDSPHSGFWYSPNIERNWNLYNWQERDNPCHPTYFMDQNRVAATNVMTTNVGVIAKSNSNNKWWISTSCLLTTRPLRNAEITIYNIQLQSIGTAQTDSDGFAVISPSGQPFALIAEHGGQKTYLRLVPGEDNSTSRFDVSGQQIERGLKGFIYGERGVWRPGDSLHVTFILHDPELRIPNNHPVTFEIYNPLGQFYNRQVATKCVSGFYSFPVATQPSDPTGLWNAYVRVGRASFHRAFRIETVRPNRLKIDLNLPDRIDASRGKIPVTLTSSWLTGATARNLNSKVEMRLSRVNTQFAGFEQFTFNNPASSFVSSEHEIFDGKIDNEGVARFEFDIPEAQNAPGMLNAGITTRVFEQGGDASINFQTVPFSPFSSYVGINLNRPDRSFIETDAPHTFNIVTLTPNGQPTNRTNLEYKIYKLNWSWWWQQQNESFENYVNSTSITPVAQGNLRTTNGRATFNFTVNYPEWGRYLVYVKDNESGHATGGIVHFDWPSSRGRANREDASGITMLAFSTDKESYNVGEEVVVTIPASAGGTALLAIENGSTVLNRTWVSVANQGDTQYRFRVTPEMAPNFYIHISLLQPHAQTINDLPIRMYGVVPVMVFNQESILNPRIEMPDVLRPETEFTIRVSEQNGKPMTYTLAIVDDGLLDLTNFRTPNPWNHFYAREALGIRTWDMYDFVIGAFSGRYGSLFAVGGDEQLRPANRQANRFRPVVKHLGPFTTTRNGTNTHRITLPPYVGSVRTMVVAGQDGAFGNAEKTTPVRSPLMVLSSLPRVLSTNEEIVLPVNVFAMENSVRNVNVQVQTTGLLQAANGNRQSLTFNTPGDDILYFPMKTNGKTGVETITITATGNGQTATETIEIEVRNPNPPIILAQNKLLNAGETAEFLYQMSGEATSEDWIKLEVSRIPSVDITRRLDFLQNYTHLCTEQVTSVAFPLLFVSQFKELNAAENEQNTRNIRNAIQQLYGRQLNGGGMVFWAGQSQVNNWVTTYVGHFLLLAREKGFEVNEGVLNRWRTFQQREARTWSPSTANNYHSRDSELQQAYRLYTLALAGSPELGAMNRMKEMRNLSQQARWRLAAAYALIGQTTAAEELIFNIPISVEEHSGGDTFGSSIRDEAMILETLTLMGRLDIAFRQAQSLSERLSKESWFSTQSTAYALIAMASLSEKMSGTIQFNWTLNGRAQTAVNSRRAVFQTDLATRPANGNLSLTNNGDGVLYVNLVTKSKPLIDTSPDVFNGLRLEVSYTDLGGNTIQVNELQQGTDFIAVVQVTNQSNRTLTDLALTHIIPSGWEIFNERLFSANETTDNSYTYRDIRDDRVLTYFDLQRTQTKTFRVRLQAAYVGTFVLPAILCEAMYDTEVNGRLRSGSVRVMR
jgi:uncharacterized protein YfaS (alpha-2-macroglobulin family)